MNLDEYRMDTEALMNYAVTINYIRARIRQQAHQVEEEHSRNSLDNQQVVTKLSKKIAHIQKAMAPDPHAPEPAHYTHHVMPV